MVADLDLSKPFEQLNAQVLCKTLTWEYFAGWLAKDYKIVTGRHK